jgi:hypothetical protein
MLRAWPEVWEERYRRDFSGDLRVYIDDPPPGAQLPRAEQAQVELAGTELRLVSSRLGLSVGGTFSGPQLELRFFSQPDGQGDHAVVQLTRLGRAKASNDRGEPLVVRAELKSEDERTQFSVHIPYTVAKGQNRWLTGIEHRRYSIGIGDARRNLYLASSARQVEAALAHELGAGLKTWQAVFQHYGYIPTGIGTYSLPIAQGVRWDDFSDSGGYAHLIGAAAQWLLCLDGKRDWELHRVPAIGQ